MRTAFRRLALLVPAVAAALGVAVAVWWATLAWVQREERSAISIALARANLGAETLEQSMSRVVDQVEGLFELLVARQRMIEAGDQAGRLALEQQVLNLAHRRDLAMNQVAIAGLDGVVRWTATPPVGPGNAFVGDAEHFRVPRAGVNELYVSETFFSRVTNRWALIFSRPLRDSAGEIIGVAMVSMNPLLVSRRLAAINLGQGGVGLLLRRDGAILADSREREPGRTGRIGSAHPVLGAIRLARGGQLEVSEPLEGGRPQLIGYRVMRQAPLVLVVALDTETELAAVDGLRRAAYVAALVIMLLSAAALLLGVLFAERWRTLEALDAARAENEAALETLAQGQRMEALGRLAGGVAHDINNVLQAVLGGARLIIKRSQDPALHRLAQLISEAAERGGAVTRRLLAFARRDNLEAEPVPVPALLEGVREVLAHSLGASIKVAVSMPPGLPALLADRSQLETVLLNLAINARDAMASFGGELRLSAAAVIMEEDNRQGLAPGHYVRLEVADNGAGMDAETLRRATEPFFTTKQKGQGTGLGLAMAQGFCEQSGGAMEIHSAPGEGTRVTLWLPRAAAISSVTRPLGSMPSRQERRCHILLVDDEPEVLAVLAAGLRDRGHMVVTAVGALEAVGALSADPRVDVLVTDLSMPGMDGVKLIEEARRQRPGLPAVLVTGFVAEAEDELHHASGTGPIQVLRKPVAPEVLAERIMDLLLPARQTA
ncbi:ATP-binding protein [Rhodovarius lipocyclicus]|uniref:ATP-binding protein n=1 Tax=Rhodovarius lipocyclicus TaxID=268410 RepID=UPI00135CB1B3|nr:ATP-binding protein [Rhodovarius lipocyclicus]